MEHILAYLPFLSPRKRKLDYEASEGVIEEIPDRATSAYQRKKPRHYTVQRIEEAQQTDKYRFAVEFLSQGDVKEARGLLSHASKGDGTRSIRIEALAFQTRRQAFQTFRYGQPSPPSLV